MLYTILFFIGALLTDTSRTDAYLSGQYGEATMTIEGRTQGGFGVHARSVYDINAVHRVFGEASYQWNKSRDNYGVENADYERLYPYLTTDTVGGGLKTETYSFRGGYRMEKKHVIWHAGLMFRAVQSYRNVDPRPKNKVADLTVDGSVGYSDAQYAYSALVHVGRYKQTNEVKFYSELGESQIYHLVAPATEYARFSGNKKNSYYHGLRAGIGFQLSPRRKGWMAVASYEWNRVTKELEDNVNIPIGRLDKHAIRVEIGYRMPLWYALLTAGVDIRQGTQYLYGAAKDNYYYLLLRQPTYLEHAWQIGAEGSYRLALPTGYMLFAGHMAYALKNHSDSDVSERFRLLGEWLSDDKLGIEVSIRYTFPIKGRFSWFIAPVATYDRYIKTTHHRWQVALSTGLTF